MAIPFQTLKNEMSRGLPKSTLSYDSILWMQTYLERFVQETMTDALMITDNAGRKLVKPSDLELAMKLRGGRNAATDEGV